MGGNLYMSQEKSPKRVSIFNRIDAFNIADNCETKDRKTVINNKKMFFIFLLITLVISPLFIISLAYGTESTVIFRNDQNIGGIRVGRILTTSEYPTQPFAVDNNGTVIYADVSNISSIYVQMLGFVNIPKALFEVVKANASLMLSLYVFLLITNQVAINNHGYADFVPIVMTLPIYPYLLNYSSNLIIGNFGTNFNHDVKIKVSANSYMLPIFSLNFILTTYRDSNGHSIVCSVIGIWDKLLDSTTTIDIAKVSRGLWEVTIGTISYNYENADMYQHQDINGLLTSSNPTTPVNCSLTVTSNPFDLLDIFTPVTDYTTSTLSSF